MPSPEIPQWLTDYLNRGFRLVFYPQKQKGPSGPDAEGWTKRSDGPQQYIEWMTKYGSPPNVGTFLGHEISPGKFLADVDFDWSESPHTSKQLLPRTSFGYGRQSKSLSHGFYTTSQPVISEKYKDIDDTTVLLELRGLTKDGKVAYQTMMPPSIHPSGELLEQKGDPEIGHAEDLQRSVVLSAIACLLVKNLKESTDRALKHDPRLGAAGFLLQEGLSEDEVIQICRLITTITGNDTQDVVPSVRTTWERLKAHQPVLGRGELVKAIGKTGPQVINRILQWLGHQDFVYDKTGAKIVPNNEANVLTALEKMEIVVQTDIFLDKFFINYNGYSGVLEDRVFDRVWLDIQKNFFFTPTKDYYETVVRSKAWQNPYHPVRDYLKALVWDGIPRVDEWLIRFGGASDSAYSRAVGAIVLIAAVHRVRNPGCKFDELMVLESEQGMLKSSALKALCPVEDWFSDDLPLDVDAKQIIERTSGKWIIEASEMSGMRTSRIEQLKSMLSRSVDGPVRMAYGRIPIEKPRQFIIVGTTNSDKYLVDDTGNRRFWPVKVQKFNISDLISSRDQLWAEAADREARGESIRLKEEMYIDAGLEQDRKRLEDPWEERLSIVTESPCKEGCDFSISKGWICTNCYHGKNKKCELTYEELYIITQVPVERRNSMTNRRIATVMQRLGFCNGVFRRGDDVIRGWKRKQEDYYD